jgi:glycosyltransferase involved in cell wall biosynthesis
MSPLDLSFVVPVKNEEATLGELLSRIAAASDAAERSFEVIFVDDGSDDSSWSVIRSLVNASGRPVRAIRFRKNLGKAAALAAGFRAACGNVVFTMDADLQDDPRDIGRFLSKLDEGFDIVSGWKRIRHDPWHKVLPSRIFNAMLSALTGTALHDHNCGFKCYRREVIHEISLYGERHRMIPALGSIRGFRSTEIAVTHHPRRFGRSKYGLSRFFRGFMDMLTVAFLQNYRERPLHLLGGLALALSTLGFLSFGVAFVPAVNVRAATALEVVGGSLVACSIPLFALGFVAELLVDKLHGLRPPLAISEEIPTTEVSINRELVMVTPPSSLSDAEQSGAIASASSRPPKKQVA